MQKVTHSQPVVRHHPGLPQGWSGVLLEAWGPLPWPAPASRPPSFLCSHGFPLPTRSPGGCERMRSLRLRPALLADPSRVTVTRVRTVCPRCQQPHLWVLLWLQSLAWLSRGCRLFEISAGSPLLTHCGEKASVKTRKGWLHMLQSQKRRWILH